MASILMDATRNKEFVETHEDLLEELEGRGSKSSTSNATFKEVYISPEEEAELLKMYETVVAQDFEDDYHMSREEREKLQERYAKFFKLKKGFTKKVRNLEKYVKAYRLCMEIIDDMAATNGVYPPDKFKKKVLEGSIVINGLNFPKFQGKKKKLISWDWVAEFIIDPKRDLRELIAPDEIAEENINTDSEILFEEGEIERIVEKTDFEDTQLDFDAIIGGTSDKLASTFGKKTKKTLIKACPSYVRTVANLGKKAKDTRANTKVWELDDGEIKALEEYDAKVRGKNTVLMPEFKGDFMNSNDVDAYLLKLDEYEKEHSFVNYHGKMISESQLEDIILMEALEENGWNLRNLYGNKDEEKRKRKANKDNQKRIETLRKMLALAQEQNEDREKGLSEEEIRKKTKKKLDELEKKENKRKKKKKKQKKESSRIILDAVNRDEADFKEYQKKMKSLMDY